MFFLNSVCFLHFVSYSVQALYAQRCCLPPPSLSLRGLTFVDGRVCVIQVVLHHRYFKKHMHGTYTHTLTHQHTRTHRIIPMYTWLFDIFKIMDSFITYITKPLLQTTIYEN